MKREDAKIGMRVRYAPRKWPNYVSPGQVTSGTIVGGIASTVGPLVAIDGGALIRAAWGDFRHLADTNHWIQWSGGECPIAPDTEVEVRFRAGHTAIDNAKNWDWTHDDEHGFSDIIGYRLTQPKRPAIVALLDDNGTPKPAKFPHVHTSRDAAIAEAERLAVRHNGSTFGVYELVARSTAPAAHTEVL